MAFAEVDSGVRLFFRDLGEGPPLVLLHGWTMSHQVWDRQVQYLSRDHRLILPDLRGHGQSDKPLWSYDVDGHADDILALLEHLKLSSVTVIGWSFGGTTALGFASAHPERATRLVLVNAAGPKYLAAPDFAHGHSEETLQEWLAKERDGVAPWRRYCMEAMPHLPYDPLFTDWLWQQSMQTPSWAAAPMLEAYARADLRPRLQQIVAPTLILHGRHDVFCALEAARCLAEGIPDAELVVFDRSGHSPQWEEPEKFRRALTQFLAGA